VEHQEFGKNIKNLHNKGVIKMNKNVIVTKEAIVKAQGIHDQKNAKMVFCISTGEMFISVADAAAANSVTPGRMSQVLSCTHKGAMCNGKRFCFVSDILVYIDEFARNYRNNINYEEIKRKEHEAIIMEKIRVLEEKLDEQQFTYSRLIEKATNVANRISFIKDQLNSLYADLNNL
jgi:hypothetical protein